MAVWTWVAPVRHTRTQVGAGAGWGGGGGAMPSTAIHHCVAVARSPSLSLGLCFFLCKMGLTLPSPGGCGLFIVITVCQALCELSFQQQIKTDLPLPLSILNT